MTTMSIVADQQEGSLASLFAALANPDRLEIMEYLRLVVRDCPEGASITCVAEEMGLSRFSASRHLRVLVSAGLVEAAASDRAILHRPVLSRFEQIEDWAYGHAC